MKTHKISKQLIIELLIVALYCAFHALTIRHHEMWRDEAQAWLLARDTTFSQMIGQLKIEGHPALWFLVLRPFAQLGFEVSVISLICLVCMTIAVFLLVHFAPFPYWSKVILLLSSMFFYTVPVIARVYALIVLLMVAIASIYNRRMKHPWIYTILIALLFQTHIIMAGFAIMLGLLFVVDVLQEKNRKISHCLSAILPFVSLILVILELRGSGRVSGGSVLGDIFENIPKTIVDLYEQFEFTMEQAVGQELSMTVFSIFFIIFLVLAVLNWKKCWKELFILIGGIGAQVLINEFVYPTLPIRASMMLVIELFFVWVVSEKIKLEPSYFGNVFRGYMLALLLVLSVISFWHGKDSWKEDWDRRYSDGKMMAEYIEANIPEDIVIVSNDAGQTTISAYVDRVKFWDPSSETYYTYVNYIQKDWNEYKTYAEIKGAIDKNFDSLDNVYLIIHNYHIPDDLNMDELEPLIASMEYPIMQDECFTLYRFK